MGSVSLLTREGEVEIAKRIEEGEKEVLRALLACRMAVAEILDIGNRLKAGKLRVREVVKDAPEEDDETADEQRPDRPGGEADEQDPPARPRQRAVHRADDARRPARISEGKRKEYRDAIARNEAAMMEMLPRCG